MCTLHFFRAPCPFPSLLLSDVTIDLGMRRQPRRLIQWGGKPAECGEDSLKNLYYLLYGYFRRPWPSVSTSGIVEKASYVLNVGSFRFFLSRIYVRDVY